MFLLITQNQFYRKAPHLVMLGHIYPNFLHWINAIQHCMGWHIGIFVGYPMLTNKFIHHFFNFLILFISSRVIDIDCMDMVNYHAAHHHITVNLLCRIGEKGPCSNLYKMHNIFFKMPESPKLLWWHHIKARFCPMEACYCVTLACVGVNAAEGKWHRHGKSNVFIWCHTLQKCS